MLMKTIQLGEQELTLKSSAAIPRIYRVKFGRDIIKDMAKLEQAYAANAGKPVSLLEIEDLTVFENIAYTMAYHANPGIPDNIDEWLEQYEIFYIYSILPEILKLWGQNVFTSEEPKKNTEQPSEK